MAELRDARLPLDAITDCDVGPGRAGGGKLRSGELCRHEGRVHACAYVPDRSASLLGAQERPLASCLTASESSRVCAQERFLCAGLPAAWDGKEGEAPSLMSMS